MLCRATRLSLLSAAALLATLTCGIAGAASPSLNLILPRGVQRGAEHVISFTGGNLADAQEIFFYSPGFTVTKLEGTAGAAKATVQVAPDCQIGEHVAQVRTASGISEYRTFYVGALPAVDEKEPNSEFTEPQAIELNVTVQGVVTGEDVDYFVVEAKKGQRISAEVEGMRLGATLFDPYIAILDEKRFELVAVDDSPLVDQDAFASVVAPEDGRYFVQVRESAYGGNGNCRYRLHVGTFPRPTGVFPAGGKLGEETEIRFLNDPSGDIVQKVTLPSEPVDNFAVFAEDANGIAASGNPFRLFEHGNAFEVEPNNGIPEATPVELPLAFNGIIETADDVDCFKFAAKKGQSFEIECYARRVGSPLDPVLNVYYADGRGIAGNDDSRGPDSYLRFNVPADGDYVVRVTDHLGQGGKDFTYRIEFSPVQGSLTLGIPRVARYSQYRQTIYVPRGNRFATLISASRVNFGGELVLEPDALPAGITMVTENMPANMTLVPVVFEAAADAPLSGQLVDFRARHADPKVAITGGFTNRADFVIAAPGQSLYRWCDVNRLAIAVIDELPFSLEIVEPKVPLVRNGSMGLKIVAHKKEGWDEPIQVQFPFRPPGVGAASSVTIPKGQTEVLYTINANGNAQVKPWKVYAIGSANVGGNAWAASQLATLEIAEPYVQVAMQRADVEQGQETEIVCQITHNRAFDGVAKVQLLGLPHKVEAVALDLAKDVNELIFKIKTDASSPAGNHKNIFCQVVVPENGESVVHARVGGTELRIDKPLPPKVDEPAPAKAPAPMPVAKKEEPKPAPEKRLTRLEKLRLEAKTRAESGASQ